MTSYHFDVGNSLDGPIGFCARVVAATADQALARLRAYLTEMVDGYATYDDCTDNLSDRPATGIEYLRIYFNPERVALAHISSEDETEETEESVTVTRE